MPCTPVPPEWPPFPVRDSTALAWLVGLVLPAKRESPTGNRHCEQCSSGGTTQHNKEREGERPRKGLLVAEVSSTGGK